MIAILVIIHLMIQVIVQVIPIQIAAITHQNNQQMMKNIINLKDKDYIDHVYILLIIS
jgi:hypothetical protein